MSVTLISCGQKEQDIPRVNVTFSRTITQGNASFEGKSLGLDVFVMMNATTPEKTIELVQGDKIAYVLTKGKGIVRVSIGEDVIFESDLSVLEKEKTGTFVIP